MNSKITLAASALVLAGVLVASYGCASSGDGGKGGSGGTSSSSTNSGGGGGQSSSNGDAGSSGSSAGGGDSFTFSSGKAAGLFTGFGFVAMGQADTVTDPTCKLDDGTTKAITKADACTTTTNWKESGNGKLCLTGSIPSLADVNPDYTGNWGVQIGVNAKEPNDAMGTAMSAYKTITFTFSGTPSSGIRGLLHRHGDDPGTTYPYCFDGIKSGKAYDLIKFNTHCWGTSEAGAAYLTEEDLPKLDLIGIQVSSVQGSSITVSDLCLEKVEFGK
jgi:hypothetical protein